MLSEVPSCALCGSPRGLLTMFYQGYVQLGTQYQNVLQWKMEFYVVIGQVKVVPNHLKKISLLQRSV
jgi:hypothetical protein